MNHPKASKLSLAALGDTMKRVATAFAACLAFALAAPAAAETCDNWAVHQGWGNTPDYAINLDCREEQFQIGPAGDLVHRWERHPGAPFFDPWHSLGGVLRQGRSVTGWDYRVAAARNKDGRLEVFAIGIHGSMFHIWQTTPGGSWSHWEDLGGLLVSSPEVRRWSDGTLEVRAIGPDGIWHYKRQAGPSRGPWSANWY